MVMTQLVPMNLDPTLAVQRGAYFKWTPGIDEMREKKRTFLGPDPVASDKHDFSITLIQHDIAIGFGRAVCRCRVMKG